MKSSIPTQTILPTTTTTQDEHQEQEQRLYMPSLTSFKVCSLIVGLLVGFFIYLSTLGAEFVAVMLWGKDILAKSNTDLVFFSLAWNLATTLVALVILASLRKMVSAVFRTVHSNNTHPKLEEWTAELLSYLEGRFAVGALVGICISWNITNMILGMRPQVIQSCIILAVACLWCRVTLILLGGPTEALIYDVADAEAEADAEEQQQQLEKKTTQTVASVYNDNDSAVQLGEPLLVNSGV